MAAQPSDSSRKTPPAALVDSDPNRRSAIDSWRPAEHPTAPAPADGDRAGGNRAALCRRRSRRAGLPLAAERGAPPDRPRRRGGRPRRAAFRGRTAAAADLSRPAHDPSADGRHRLSLEQGRPDRADHRARAFDHHQPGLSREPDAPAVRGRREADPPQAGRAGRRARLSGAPGAATTPGPPTTRSTASRWTASRAPRSR